MQRKRIQEKKFFANKKFLKEKNLKKIYCKYFFEDMNFQIRKMKSFRKKFKKKKKMIHKAMTYPKLWTHSK